MKNKLKITKNVYTCKNCDTKEGHKKCLKILKNYGHKK